MLELEAVMDWVEAHETFLSGLAAAVFLLTLAVGPLAAPIARAARALRQRRSASGDAPDSAGNGATPSLSAEEILDRPAVAVLPFANPSHDPEQDYFASGITEDLITALSSFRCFPVIGRSSVYADAAAQGDVCAMGEALAARYVAHGSVRRDGAQVRIHAQLTDVSTGHTLWAQSYDRDFAGVFALQDEITREIVTAIEPRVGRAEERRVLAAADDDLDAWDSCLRALWHIRAGTPDDLARARRLLEWAIVRDPLSSRAHALLALCLFQDALLGGHADAPVALAGTLRAARAAVDLDEADWLAHALLGIAMLWTLRDYDGALAEQDRALALNPSGAISHQFRACVLQFSGRPADAVKSLELVLRLEPQYQSRAMVLSDLSLCHLLLDRPEEAAALARRAIDESPDNVRAHHRLTAALGRAGEAEAARAAVAALLELVPDANVEEIVSTYPFRDPGDLARFATDLRAAGLPESPPAMRREATVARATRRLEFSG